jgi:hypothetical protein
MRTPLFVAAACLAAGTFAFAQTVTHDVDRSADFPSIKTYQWGHRSAVEKMFNKYPRGH